MTELEQAEETIERLEEAVKLAYRKHVNQDDNIGWTELGDKLCDALCNSMGDAEFTEWNDKEKGL